MKRITLEHPDNATVHRATEENNDNRKDDDRCFDATDCSTAMSFLRWQSRDGANRDKSKVVSSVMHKLQLSPRKFGRIRTQRKQLEHSDRLPGRRELPGVDEVAWVDADKASTDLGFKKHRSVEL